MLRSKSLFILVVSQSPPKAKWDGRRFAIITLLKSPGGGGPHGLGENFRVPGNLRARLLMGTLTQPLSKAFGCSNAGVWSVTNLTAAMIT